MRQRILSVFLALLAGWFAAPAAFPADPGGAAYQVVHGWPQLPAGFTFGEVSSVAVDSHNHVFVTHHGADGLNQEHPVMCFDGATGKLLAAWGEGLSLHGMAVDSRDNLWFVSAKQHQVYQFSHDGELLMTVGAKDVAGLDGHHFNKPTAVTVAPGGEFYVADGYVNSRIAKFSAKGDFLLDWGRKGTAAGEFDIPHGVALDAQGRVYVADRGNNRIQVFDAAGKYICQWKSAEMGRPWAIAISKQGYLFVADGGETNKFKPEHAGVSQLDLQGKLLDHFGGLGQYDGQFYWAHGIAAGPNGDVYVTDVHVGRRVQKFVRR